MNDVQPEYVGFWARFVAVIVNTIIVSVAVAIVMKLMGIDLATAGASLEEMQAQMSRVQSIDLLISIVFFIGAWIAMQTDPGKMIFGAVIVDAKTGAKPSVLQFVLRYLGYIVSTLPLCLGFLWVAWDARKQGFHDKIAGTVVVKKRA